MQEYQPRQDSEPQPTEEMAVDSGEGMPELAEQTEMPFVTESSGQGKNTALVLLGLLIVGAGAIYFMRWKTGPQAASAANPDAAIANTTISKAIKDGGKEVQEMKETLKKTDRWRKLFLSYPFHSQVKLEKLQTNPFLFAEKQEPTPEDPAKIAREQHEKAKAEALKAAGQLRLQSILAGHTPTCMINGQACTEGQEIKGFTVEKITREGVVVKKGEFKFELRMQR